MKRLLPMIGTLAICLFWLTAPAQAATTFVSPSDQQESVSLSQATSDDAFVVGRAVGVTAPVGGELFAAGNTVDLSSRTERSIFAAGNVVNIDQGSGYNTFAAGNTVTLSGTYGHDVYLAGSTVIIKDGTVINGDLRVTGSSVTLAGTVKGSVYVSAQQVISSAIIGGSLRGEASSYQFTAGSIGGDFRYQSADKASGLNRVAIAGTVERSDPPTQSKHAAYMPALFWIESILSLLLLGAALIIFLPRRIGLLSQEVRGSWSRTFTVGMAALLVIPLIAIVAFMTVIGWKIGFILLAFYVVALMVAGAVATMAFGRMVLERFAGQHSLWLDLIVGGILVAGLTAVPLVGWLVSTAFFLGLIVPVFGSLVSLAQQRD